MKVQGLEAGVLTLSYLISTLIGLFAHHVIRMYHRNKPLGFQTLLTQVTILCSQVCSFLMISNAIIQVTSELYGLFPKWLAITFTALMIYLGQIFALMVFFMVASKYLSIYHSERLATINDEKLIRLMKIVMIVVPADLTAIELLYLSDYEDMSGFQWRYYGHASPDSKSSKISNINLMIITAAAATLQIRTELDALKAQDAETGCAVKCWLWIKSFKNEQEEEVNVNANDPGYSIQSIRVLILVCLLMAAVFVYGQVGGGDTIKWNMIIFTSLFFDGIPLILILRHDGKKNLALRVLKCLN